MSEPARGSAEYFLVGICGAGMSSLALLLQSLGMHVSGTDLNSTGTEAQSLRSRGIEVFSEDDGAARLRSGEAVVRSSAIHPDNSVLVSAERLGLLVQHRSEVLAAVASQYFLIAVAGTHGKTTTAGMIGYVLASEGLSPTIYVGGHIVGFDRCFPEDRTLAMKVLGHPIMVLETDESDRSFLKFRANVAVVTNIDRDHLGTYQGSFAKLVAAFGEFLGQCDAQEGLAIGCGDDTEVRRIVGGMERHTLYGEEASNQVRIAYDAAANTATIFRANVPQVFQMERGDEKSYQNAVAAALACEAIGVRFEDALRDLKDFPGMERRMQVLADSHGVVVLTDHADHPTEIRATLQAVSVRYPARRLTLVLQPHRFSRVTSCLDQYGPALSGVDRVILLDIFTAGETTEQPQQLNERLWKSIRNAIGEPLQKPLPAEQTLGFLLSSIAPGDVVLFMGPGDVNKLGLRFCGLLSGCNAVEYDTTVSLKEHGRQENC
ncbi:MAG: UDP-N-acetylmuramate--L-alanine ligase [Candidatus Cryosericum sp.]